MMAPCIFRRMRAVTACSSGYQEWRRPPRDSSSFCGMNIVGASWSLFRYLCVYGRWGSPFVLARRGVRLRRIGIGFFSVQFACSCMVFMSPQCIVLRYIFIHDFLANPFKALTRFIWEMRNGMPALLTVSCHTHGQQSTSFKPDHLAWVNVDIERFTNN